MYSTVNYRTFNTTRVFSVNTGPPPSYEQSLNHPTCALPNHLPKSSNIAQNCHQHTPNDPYRSQQSNAERILTSSHPLPNNNGDNHPNHSSATAIPSPPETYLNVFLQNADGLTSKIDLLRAQNFDSHDIILLNETKLTDRVSDHAITLPNFTLFRKDGARGTHGSVALCKSLLMPTRLTRLEAVFESHNIEAIVFRISLPDQSKMAFVHIYRPPGSPAVWLSNLEDSIGQVRRVVPATVISGDFNLDLLKVTRQPTRFKEILRRLNTSVHSVFPTRIQTRNRRSRSATTSKTCLDIIATPINSQVEFYRISEHTDLFSDHQPINCAIRIAGSTTNSTAPHQKAQYRRNFNLLTKARTALALTKHAHHLDTVLAATEPELAIGRLQEVLLTVLNEVCPLIKVKPSSFRKLVPWETRKTKMALRKCKRAAKLHVRNPTPRAYRSLEKLKKHLKDCRLAAARNYGNFVAKSKNFKRICSHLKKITLANTDSTQKSPPISPSLLNNAFAETVTESSTHRNWEEPLCIPDPPTDQFSLKEFTTENISTALRKLRNSNAVGPDDIPNSLLKAANPIIARHLCHIMNLCVQSNYFPPRWKRSLIVAIHKKGPLDVANNYRPISLISTLGKVLEGLIADQLGAYAFRHNLINNDQFGFRPNSGTETAILAALSDWTTACGQGLFTGVLQIDLSKAFDCIPHAGINFLLRQFCDPSSTAMLADFLQNRNQRLRSSKSTQWKPVTRGVPQGSKLSPLIFAMFIACLGRHVRHCKIIQYADDTAVYYSARTVEEVKRQLQSEFDNLTTIYSQLNMKLNASKTIFFLVRPKRIPPAHITIGNVQIAESNSLNLLGFRLANNLSAAPQVGYVARVVRAKLGELAAARSKMPKHLARTFYVVYIRPHLEYAGMALETLATETEKRLLEGLQTRAVRLVAYGRQFVTRNINGARSHISGISEPARRSLGLEKLASRRQSRLRNLCNAVDSGAPTHPLVPGLLAEPPAMPNRWRRITLAATIARCNQPVA